MDYNEIAKYEKAIKDCKKLIDLEPENQSHQKNLNSLQELFRLNQRFLYFFKTSLITQIVEETL